MNFIKKVRVRKEFIMGKIKDNTIRNKIFVFNIIMVITVLVIFIHDLRTPLTAVKASLKAMFLYGSG